MPQYRPHVQHAHHGHMTYYDHFDDRVQGNVLVAMDVGTGKGTPKDPNIPWWLLATRSMPIQQCSLKKGIVTCDCTAYSQTSLLTDPSNAMGPANVHIHFVD